MKDGTDGSGKKKCGQHIARLKIGVRAGQEAEEAQRPVGWKDSPERNSKVRAELESSGLGRTLQKPTTGIRSEHLVLWGKGKHHFFRKGGNKGTPSKGLRSFPKKKRGKLCFKTRRDLGGESGNSPDKNPVELKREGGIGPLLLRELRERQERDPQHKSPPQSLRKKGFL